MEEIGKGKDALQCVTSSEDCCKDPSSGTFYYPNGRKVSSTAADEGFYLTYSEESRIYLHRNENTGSPSGRYRCEIHTPSGEMKNVYIYIFYIPLEIN